MIPEVRLPADDAVVARVLARGVTQSRVGWPWGNCLEACLATLFAVPLDRIPDARREVEAQGTTQGPMLHDAIARRRDELLHDWVLSRGFLWIRTRDLNLPAHRAPSAPPVLWIASGPSPRGFQHAVIYAGPQLLWDPHYSRAGLVRVTHASLFVPLGDLA